MRAALDGVPIDLNAAAHFGASIRASPGAGSTFGAEVSCWLGFIPLADGMFGGARPVCLR
jgi:hypothetical protein